MKKYYDHRSVMYIWVFPKIGVFPKHPKMIIFSRENPWLLGKPAIFGNIHILNLQPGKPHLLQAGSWLHQKLQIGTIHGAADLSEVSLLKRPNNGGPCVLLSSSICVFPKIGVPQIIHFNTVFHYKPSILGYPYLETPICAEKITPA